MIRLRVKEFADAKKSALIAWLEAQMWITRRYKSFSVIPMQM
jgi:hypothetical protein